MFRRKIMSSNYFCLKKLCVCVHCLHVYRYVHLCIGMRRLEKDVESSGVSHYCFLSYSLFSYGTWSLPIFGEAGN